MTPKIGYFLSCEEFQPPQLLEQAELAYGARFDRLAISDHYHPWTDAQGSSPFVWFMIGALSQAAPLPITTLVTRPHRSTVRGVLRFLPGDAGAPTDVFSLGARIRTLSDGRTRAGI